MNMSEVSKFNLNQQNMTNTTKTLLTISVTAFLVGTTGALWGIGTPVGAIFLGLCMISKILEKESALFDSEQRLRWNLAEGTQSSSPEPVGKPAFLGMAVQSH
jgi:hypothetical protein